VVPVADFPFAADISRPLSGPFNEEPAGGV